MQRELSANWQDKKYSPPELLQEANAIRSTFPCEKWLIALPAYMNIVLANLVYLGITPCAWPVRAQARRELEIAMTRDELPP